MASLGKNAQAFVGLCTEFERQVRTGADWTLLLKRVKSSYEKLGCGDKLELFAALEGIDDFKTARNHHLFGLTDEVILGLCEAMANDHDAAEHALALESFNELKIADPAPYARLQKLKGTTLFLNIAEIDGTLPSHPAQAGPV